MAAASRAVPATVPTAMRDVPAAVPEVPAAV
jgi:hypothetical protein